MSNICFFFVQMQGRLIPLFRILSKNKDSDSLGRWGRHSSMICSQLFFLYLQAVVSPVSGGAGREQTEHLAARTSLQDVKSCNQRTSMQLYLKGSEQMEDVWDKSNIEYFSSRAFSYFLIFESDVLKNGYRYYMFRSIQANRIFLRGSQCTFI